MINILNRRPSPGNKRDVFCYHSSGLLLQCHWSDYYTLAPWLHNGVIPSHECPICWPVLDQPTFTPGDNLLLHLFNHFPKPHQTSSTRTPTSPPQTHTHPSSDSLRHDISVRCEWQWKLIWKTQKRNPIHAFHGWALARRWVMLVSEAARTWWQLLNVSLQHVPRDGLRSCLHAEGHLRRLISSPRSGNKNTGNQAENTGRWLLCPQLGFNQAVEFSFSKWANHMTDFKCHCY